jgi:SAM-dependent methyltransferase
MVCDSRLRGWIHAGPVDHRNRVCPVCFSFGRQRMMARVLERELARNAANSGITLLHFAPEFGLQGWIRERFPSLNYVSADLGSPDVDRNLDVQALDLPDRGVDIVVLSHVLEHVEDDALALRELYRVLVPEGLLFVQVPIGRGRATQEEKLDTPEQRLARYGKSDHVRLYGDDIRMRLERAGFEVRVYRARDDAFIKDFDFMALDIPPESTMPYENESTTFVCHKSR